MEDQVKEVTEMGITAMQLGLYDEVEITSGRCQLLFGSPESRLMKKKWRDMLGSDVFQANYMERRIPRNPKYEHIKTQLDTGCSLTKHAERLEDIKKNYRYRADEVFKRLKVSSFAQLILQVASGFHLNECEDGDSHSPDDALSEMSDADLESLSKYTNSALHTSPLSDPHDAGDTRENCYTSRSTLLSVVSGVGELSLGMKCQKMDNEADRPYPDCPYLLLDVRDLDQYNRCHIISAHSFPVAQLSQTMNPFSKEVLEYKNTAGKFIIVYDENERIASQAATTMCQRGVENLFMLSGGLKVIAQKFPEGLTTGSIPIPCLSSPTSSKGKKGAVQQQMQAAEMRRRFTSDELTKIQEQLEEILIPSNQSSRFRRMWTLSSHFSASGRNSSRLQSSQPWK
ncbi:centrosomal protein of 41 kDa-like [Platichthys flesus]|uniref:centrosomal protein of 41 kDa-like n=1 Tax=Platichthys flesus TaxID=8260 RepID=UPI002DBF1EAC|nr:centrosomal protein of 41 kDa-like [Platichthys flesus]